MWLKEERKEALASIEELSGMEYKDFCDFYNGGHFRGNMLLITALNKKITKLDEKVKMLENAIDSSDVPLP